MNLNLFTILRIYVALSLWAEWRDVQFLSDYGNELRFQIKYVPVNIKEYFRTFLLAPHADTLNRSVVLSAKVPPEVSESVLCDGTRLYYAISYRPQSCTTL